MRQMKKFQAGPADTRAPVSVVEADPDEGLTKDQVLERQRGGWANVSVSGPTRTEKEIVKENVFTFFNLIFLVLAAALFAVGSYKDATFIFIAVINTGIGIFQELRSKKTVDKLKLLAASRGTVVRAGMEMSVPTDHMVRDDIAVFSAGDQISADGVVRSGAVQVNEAMITGEADPLEKGPGDKLRSGSFIVSGSCRAQLTQVGADSYAARLTLEAKKGVKAGQSEMMASLTKLIRFIGIALIPMGAILLWKQYFVLLLISAIVCINWKSKFKFSKLISNIIFPVFTISLKSLYTFSISSAFVSLPPIPYT